MNHLALTALWKLFLVTSLALLLAACAAPQPPSGSSTPSSPPVAAGTRIPFEGGMLTVTRAGASCTVRLDGEVNPNTARRLSQAFAEVDQGNCREKWVVLNATQGDVGSAITVGSMLRNRDFRIRVAAGSTCLTPCWLVLVAGVERGMEAGARIGFSQIPPDADYGRRQCETELSRGQALTLTRYLRAMVPSSTATTLFQRVVLADCRSTTYWSIAEAQANGLLGASPM